MHAKLVIIYSLIKEWPKKEIHKKTGGFSPPVAP